MIFLYLPLAFGLIILGVALGQGKVAAIGVAMLAAPFVLLPLVGLLGSLRVIREFPAERRRSSPLRRAALAVGGVAPGLGLLLAVAAGAVIWLYV